MNNKFDELTKSMAQSVTRRRALKKFGLGLAGMALAAFGLANQANAAPGNAGKLECCVTAVPSSANPLATAKDAATPGYAPPVIWAASGSKRIVIASKAERRQR